MSLSKICSDVTRRIADPESCAFLAPGSGISYSGISDSGSKPQSSESLVKKIKVRNSLFCCQVTLLYLIKIYNNFNCVKFITTTIKAIDLFYSHHFLLDLRSRL
jgi:hypothetical protein